jgi:protein gp37
VVSAKSAIEWTETTWNPITGCDRISQGCDNCYALSLAARLKAMGKEKYQTDGDPRTSGPGFGVALHEGSLSLPLKWRAPRMVFVNSMSDLFHAKVPVEFVQKVFEVMRQTPRHTYQILTKRATRLSRIDEYLDWPENVWMGVSVEGVEAVPRIDALRRTHAHVKFVSAEPLLEDLGEIDLTDIDWLIAGGESGPKARPVSPGWVRGLRDRCGQAGTAFFFKQWGGRTSKSGGRVLDGRTWDEFPHRSTGRSSLSTRPVSGPGP